MIITKLTWKTLENVFEAFISFPLWLNLFDLSLKFEPRDANLDTSTVFILLKLKIRIYFIYLKKSKKKIKIKTVPFRINK
jgi:hypothetical protein